MVALHLPAPRAFLKQRQAWLIGLGATAIIVGVMAFQVSQLSNAAGTSYTINELTRQRAAKQAANHELEAEVANLSSLAHVDLDARLRLGLLPATRKLYVTVNQPLPQKQTLPTRYLPVVNEADLPAETPAWKALLRALPFF
jgi:cell division protein FtsB